LPGRTAGEKGGIGEPESFVETPAAAPAKQEVKAASAPMTERCFKAFMSWIWREVRRFLSKMAENASVVERFVPACRRMGGANARHLRRTLACLLWLAMNPSLAEASKAGLFYPHGRLGEASLPEQLPFLFGAPMFNQLSAPVRP
jgi:hypothetical protein